MFDFLDIATSLPVNGTRRDVLGPIIIALGLGWGALKWFGVL